MRAACVLVAALALAEARLRLAWTGDAAITVLLTGGGTDRPGTPQDGPWLRTFAWALQGVARRAPFRADCLIRVLAADRVLSVFGLPSRIWLQAGRDATGFASHAHLSCGGVDLTGGPNAMLQTIAEGHALREDRHANH